MERQAINFVIQASACDIMKVAMERINQILDQMFPFDFKSKSDNLFVYKKSKVIYYFCLVRPTPIRPIYLVLQIHDELLFEIEINSRINEIINIIRQTMEINNHINLTLPVQVKRGDNWESMVSVI